MLQREILGATRERMLREISEALETITARSPLMLAFEDLQWVDPSTVDLISVLSRRRAPARLMLIGTSRPLELELTAPHFKALKQELMMHRLCREVALDPLSQAQIAEYLTADSARTSEAAGLAEVIYRHSEGNPLFMVAVLDHMTRRGFVSRQNGACYPRVALEAIDLELPDGLCPMIEAQLERLSAEEQRALEAASVNSSLSFCVSVTAAAADMEPEPFEEICERLSRQNSIVRSAAPRQFPDGSVSQCYDFVHAFYREMLFRRIVTRRRARLHQCIGKRLEVLFSGRLGEAASELAHHFERAADWARAIKYLHLAADTARRRYADGEAAAILRRADELSSKLPQADRTAIEPES
jgi:predicted ATPase